MPHHIKIIFYSSLILLVSACYTKNIKQWHIDPIHYVDPFIGTDGKGKTFPGATVPHGMVQLSPDNGRAGWDWIAGYFYPDHIIAGFSHTHLSGTGAGDLYDISFMPLTRPFKKQVVDKEPKREAIVSQFSHANEKASPGYYQVYLEDYGINVELTAGKRTGYQQYTFDKEHEKGIVRLDLGYSRNWDKTIETHIQILDNRTITGYRKSTGWAKDQRVFFYTKFSQPFSNSALFVNNEVIHEKKATSINIVGEFTFDLLSNKSLTVRTALSSVSSHHAKSNFVAEGIDKSFYQVKKEAEDDWRNELKKIRVHASKDNLIQFYTAMYHASLAPRIYSDVNGTYKGPDGKKQIAKSFERYDFFSLWDTFRALHPWKTIVDQKRTQDMMSSLMSHYRVTGRLPVWSFQGNETDMMLGYHSVPVLVDAYLKGLTDIDGELLLQAAVQSAMQDNFSIKSYKELGYVPYEEAKWNVSLTLEYAYDDWVIAQLAKALGREKIYQQFSDRSKNYRHHYDPDTGFMRAKDRDGQFREPFDPNAYHPEDYTEANAWQYSYFVPHDTKGLIQLMGGKKHLEEKLDRIFSTQQSEEKLPEWISGYIGQYVHGNEPAHHLAYLYQYVDQPHKTQQRVRQIMRQLYTTEPDGLAGNEDAGQMSAWYLFSALGFYPVNPVSGHYVFGSPEVIEAVIQLENGKEFHIKTNHQSSDNVYVDSILLNGKTLQRQYLKHEDIMKGGELIFNMSKSP